MTPDDRAPSPTDRMLCRACGRPDRASEGYPCQGCGTFICVVCNLKGITLCAACEARRAARPAPGS